MKRKILSLLTALLVSVNGAALVGCDMLGGSSSSRGGNSGSNGNGDGGIPQIDNAVDLNTYTPTTDDDGICVEGESYYTSSSLMLVTEIHGNYSIHRPFALDAEDESKRIYHNVYFYADDFFQLLYFKSNGASSVYAIMSDQTDTQYAEVELTEGGSPLQINIVQEGVYNLILDTKTFGVDMVKVRDIDEPVYPAVKTCELYVFVEGTDTSYTAMTLNEQTGEYHLQAEIPANSTIGFFNAAHTGRYKTTVVPSINNTLLYWNFNNTDSIQVHVGGLYDVYFNTKKYEVRLELKNPDTATYYCQVNWNQNNVLTPVSPATPYLFTYTFVAQKNGEYLPDFYPELGMRYNLWLVDENELVYGDNSVKEAGTYTLTVNLKDFTLTVTQA